MFFFRALAEKGIARHIDASSMVLGTLIYHGKLANQIDFSFLCVCPVIDQDVRDNIVEVAVELRGDSRVDPQTTLTML